MSRSRMLASGRLLGAASALCLGFGASRSLAQTTPAAEAPPSESLAINLVQLLVKQGVISRTAADILLKQAEQETAQARVSAAVAAATPAPGAPIVTSPGAPPVVAPTALAALPPAAPGVLRVPYIPQVVRDQIREELKEEVVAQAKQEGWAAPGSIPGWLNRVSISGDVRVRSQYNLYSSNNTNELIDFATFNSSGPIDINPDTNPNGLPFLNTRQNSSNVLSLRARLAIDAKLSDFAGAGFRLATGDSNGAVSTTTLLGGGFAKNNIWLDRGFVWFKPTDGSTFTAGRMPDPFMTTDLLYSDDLNFDGATGKYVQKLPRRETTVSLTAGAFPLGYQGSNFPTNASLKNSARADFLFAGQVALDWAPSAFDLKTAVGFYDFENVRGVLSAPCALYNGNKQCSTDFTIPAIMQKGNTLFFVRDILPNPSTPLNYAQSQLLGLRFGYRLLDLNTALDYRVGVYHHLVFTGQYVRNMAYSSHDICRNAPNGLPVNNLTASALGNTDPCDAAPTGDTRAAFKSGPNAYLVKMLYGDVDPTRFGEWNVSLGYRYIQPDALLDGFNSPDFHLGGTNAKGYTLTATVGLYNGAYLQARWFSADAVYGPPLTIDVGQLDLHVRF